MNGRRSRSGGTKRKVLNLIENARRRRALRHGGGQQRLDIQDLEIPTSTKDDELLAVNDALETFAGVDKQKSELVKLPHFVGMTSQ